MNTWIATGSLAALVTVGAVGAAMADDTKDRGLDGVTVSRDATFTTSPSPARTCRTVMKS